MHLDLRSLGVLGKVPSCAEYIRLRFGAQDLAALDVWLAESMDRLLARPQEQWVTRYEQGSIYGFVFRGQSEETLVAGVVRPSADSANRKFPLVVAAAFASPSELVRRPALLPLLLEPFWVAAGLVLAESRGMDVPELERRIEAIAHGCELPGDGASEAYRAWIESTSTAALWTLLCEQRLDATEIIRLLLECVRPVRGVEHPTNSLTLKLPLGRAGGAALCFWLDLVCAAAGWKATIPSFFWSHDGTTGTVLLHLGSPPHGTVEELWAPQGLQDEFCDLTKDTSDEQARWLPGLSESLRCMCNSKEHSARKLLEAVAATCR